MKDETTTSYCWSVMTGGELKSQSPRQEGPQGQGGESGQVLAGEVPGRQQELVGLQHLVRLEQVGGKSGEGPHEPGQDQQPAFLVQVEPAFSQGPDETEQQTTEAIHSPGAPGKTAAMAALDEVTQPIAGQRTQRPCQGQPTYLLPHGTLPHSG